MLSSLEIQNFKGIKQGKIEDLAQVNILVGRNNSGKSTILDALVLLRAPIIGQDYLNRSGIEQILTRRVDRGRGNLAYDELWFRMGTGDPLTLRAALGTEATLTEQWNSRGNTNRPEASVELRNASDSPTAQKWKSSGDSGTARHYRNTNAWPAIKNNTNEGVATFLSLVHILEPNLIHQEFDEGLWFELAKDRKDKKVIGMLNHIYQTDI
ncbi:MAG: AAA family ATPase, partial [Chloroflexota bacterium]